MTYILLGVGFVGYCLQAWLGFSSIKNSDYYVHIGVLLSLVGTLCWLGITKLNEGMVLYKLGAMWDVILVMAFLLVPVIFNGIRPTPMAWSGVCLILAGLVLMHL